MNIFEKASKLKLRFDSAKGQLSVEDLWDLPLTSERKVSLNSIAINVHQNLKESETFDFVGSQSSGDVRLQLSMDIVKHVIEVRLADNEALRNKAAKATHNSRIDELVAKKQDEELADMSIEDLLKLKEA